MFGSVTVMSNVSETLAPTLSVTVTITFLKVPRSFTVGDRVILPVPFQELVYTPNDGNPVTVVVIISAPSSVAMMFFTDTLPPFMITSVTAGSTGALLIVVTLTTPVSPEEPLSLVDSSLY